MAARRPRKRRPRKPRRIRPQVGERWRRIPDKDVRVQWFARGGGQIEYRDRHGIHTPTIMASRGDTVKVCRRFAGDRSETYVLNFRVWGGGGYVGTEVFWKGRYGRGAFMTGGDPAMRKVFGRTRWYDLTPITLCKKLRRLEKRSGRKT